MHIAPFYGPNHATIYFAVDSNHTVVNPDRVYVLPGENPEPLVARLWDLLDRIDPVAVRSIVAAFLIVLL